MLLPSGWYVIAASSELKRNKPLGFERFGKDIVLWRNDSGQPVAMLDLCPHRSAKLSVGRVENDCIECPFHGFSFDQNGRCTLVPETNKAAPNLRVQTFPLREKHGFIWCWYGDEQAQVDLPWFETLDNAKWSFSEQATLWPAHITRCIENQLDYAHLPFVHKNTIGGNTDVTKPVRFELNNNSIKFYPESEEKGSGFIEFRFPNIWMLIIVPDKFAQMMAFVPVNEELTRLYLRGYQSFITLPGLCTIFNTIGAWQSKYILSQDKKVVLSQRPSSSLDAVQEILYPSDQGIRHFRDCWQEKVRKL